MGKSAPAPSGVLLCHRQKRKGARKCILNGQRRRQSMRNRRRAVSSGFLVTQVNHFLHFKGKGVGWKKPREVCPPVGLVLLSSMPLYECFTDAQRSRWSEQNGGRGAQLKSAGVLWKKARAPSWWPYLKATPHYFASSASQRLFFFFFLFSPPSLPCCSDIRQGNSSEISSATPSAKAQKIRVSHFGSSLTVLLRPPASSSFRGVPSASTINAFVFPSTRLSAFFCAGPAQHKSHPCGKAPS